MVSHSVLFLWWGKEEGERDGRGEREREKFSVLLQTMDKERVTSVERRAEKGTAEDEMVGWHHRFNGHGFEQALADGEGLGGLACCSLWGCKELDATTEQQQQTSVDGFLPPEMNKETVEEILGVFVKGTRSLGGLINLGLKTFETANFQNHEYLEFLKINRSTLSQLP